MGTTYDIELTPEQNPHKPPYQAINKANLAGDDAIRIRPSRINDEYSTPGIWRIESVRIDFTADANAANRYMSVAITKPQITKNWDFINSVAVTANQTKVLLIGRYRIFSDTIPGAASGSYYAGVGDDWGVFHTDDYGKLWIYGGLAGDTWEVNMVCRCLNRELDTLPPVTKWFRGVGG